MVRCPYLKCMNAYYKHLDEVEDDLYINGIQGTYTRWIFHGENLSSHGTYPTDNSTNNDAWGNDGMINNEEQEENEILDMLDDFQGGTFTCIRDTDITGSHQALEKDVQKFTRLLREAQRDLYPGCKKFSILSFIFIFSLIITYVELFFCFDICITLVLSF